MWWEVRTQVGGGVWGLGRQQLRAAIEDCSRKPWTQKNRCRGPMGREAKATAAAVAVATAWWFHCLSGV